MKTSSILTLLLALCLIATTALAQDYATPRIPTPPRPPSPPGVNRLGPAPPTGLIAFPSNPTGGTQESTVINLQTGSIATIHQSGNEAFVPIY
jgi:hypothetical protein